MSIDTPEKLKVAVNEFLDVLPNDLADVVTVLGATTAWVLLQIEDEAHRGQMVEVFCRSLRRSVARGREP